MLLLSRFSRVQLCATPETTAHQVPPSLGFSGKNTGVGCHFFLRPPSPDPHQIFKALFVSRFPVSI